MSYYSSNYYQNPGPYYVTSDKDEPVPGWGLMPTIAGGPRVGVGDEQPPSQSPFPPQLTVYLDDDRTDGATKALYAIGALALVGAGVAFAVNKGYLRLGRR